MTMPIVSRIGRRSLKVRLLYCALFLVLIVGAVTMIYPFLLMVTGSVKSEADLYDIAPIPRYLFDDGALFTKYVESKYNNDLRVLEACWQRPILSWESIERPEEQEFELLEEFLKWRAQSDPRWWWLGHTRGGRLLPENAREFRSLMQRRYDEDVNVFRKAMSIPVSRCHPGCSRKINAAIKMAKGTSSCITMTESDASIIDRPVNVSPY